MAMTARCSDCPNRTEKGGSRKSRATGSVTSNLQKKGEGLAGRRLRYGSAPCGGSLHWILTSWLPALLNGFAKSKEMPKYQEIGRDDRGGLGVPLINHFELAQHQGKIPEQTVFQLVISICRLVLRSFGITEWALIAFLNLRAYSFASGLLARLSF